MGDLPGSPGAASTFASFFSLSFFPFFLLVFPSTPCRARSPGVARPSTPAAARGRTPGRLPTPARGRTPGRLPTPGGVPGSRDPRLPRADSRATPDSRAESRGRETLDSRGRARADSRATPGGVPGSRDPRLPRPRAGGVPGDGRLPTPGGVPAESRLPADSRAPAESRGREALDSRGRARADSRLAGDSRARDSLLAAERNASTRKENIETKKNKIKKTGRAGRGRRPREDPRPT